MRINSNSKKGFTLVEMLAVITLLGVVAAVSTPLVGKMFDDGNNTNRSMIARTIYTSAQNQLTEKRILQSLSGFVTNANINNDGHLVYKNEKVTNTDELTGEGKAEASSKNDVYYISKPKGEKSGAVYDLLSPVIQQKDILNDSILIEFNIKTGVVLSVFYSDEVADGETLQYMAAGSNDVKNVTGKRPYEFAEKRKQGYYGVDSTGINSSKESTPMIVNIKDGITEPLADTQGHQYKNVLYADILIPTSLAQSDMKYTLKLDNKSFITGFDFTNALESINLSTELENKEGNIIYKITNGVEEGYSRFIWLIDYVGGDMVNSGSAKHSIGAKYPAISSYTGGNVFAEVQAEFSAISARSMTYVNPLFATKDSYTDGTREVSSARHLYNVRYYKNGSFIQTADIDLSEVEATNAVTNFAPIGTDNEPFTGSYNGNKNVIKNMVISCTDKRSNVGLFGVVQGELQDKDQYQAASVSNLVLHNPSVSGGTNVGSIAGSSMGLIDSVYISFDKDVSISGDARVGGVIGQNSGILKNSVFISNTDKQHVKISNYDKGIGGLAGYNEGKMEYCMFLALAPSEDSSRVIFPFISIDAASSDAYTGLYYLSGQGVRPNVGAYNTKAAYNAIGISIGSKYTYFAGMPENWKKSLKADGSQYNSDEMDAQVSNVYPYPFVFSENLLANWPVVNNTEKPPQVERPSVKTSIDERLRKNNINFLNGDFSVLHKDSESDRSYKVSGGSIYFVLRDNVPGWSTRPTQGGTPSGYDKIEFQKSRGRYDFAKTDYNGKTEEWYAELNAHVPGTLYQICDTIPGDEVYYSFYHHARSSAGGKTFIADKSAYENKMNFYLSPMKLEDGEYKYTGDKVLIRPCWVRRDVKDTTDANFKANKIFHGREKDHIDYGGGWNLPYFNLNNVYLYDIWGGDSGKYANMGVTFYSYTPVTDLGVDKIIESNIIGYWDVSNGWKRYYGFYKVPEGQNLTEFAYESQTINALSEGNFLDGIKLSTPAHLVVGNSVSKNYVSPNETIRVTFSIKNVGESSAKDIELTDSFEKFISYFEYYGNLVVKNETQNKVLQRGAGRDYTAEDKGDSFKFNIAKIRGITERREAGETAAETEGGDTITISFDVKIRNYVVDNGKPTNYSTVGYYFDNQAVVTYRDKGFDGYAISDDKKTSVSPDVRVQISPVEFQKTVVEKTSEYNKFDEYGNPIQFFEVTVKYGGNFYDSSNNPMSITGTLEEFLLPGFKVTEESKKNIGKNFDEIINPNDGSTTLRITIDDVTSTNHEKQIKYVLEYKGKSSGVLPVSTESRYTYSAYSEKTDEYYVNKLYVSSPSVGIKLKTVNSGSMSVNVGATQNLKFLDNSTDKYLKNIVNLGDYDVGAYKVVFTDENGNPKTTTDVNGNSQIINDKYEATVLRDGDGDSVISFKAKQNLNVPEKIYYKLVLSAIDIQNPSSKMVLDSRVTSVDVSTNNIPTESKTTEVTDKYKDLDANGNPIQHFEVSLSAWGEGSLSGTFTDVINSGFEVTDKSLQDLKAKYPSAAVTKNDDGTSTLVIPDYSVNKQKTPVVYTVKYTGDNYGALKISKSTTIAINVSGSTANIDVYRGEVILKPKTKDHNVDVVVGEPVTISEYIDQDLIAEAKKLQSSGYQIGSYTVSLVNEKGYERRYNLTDYAAVKGINNNITATVFSDKKAPYYIYYVLKFNVTDGDGNPVQLLVSRPTKIILNIKK